MTRVGLRVTVGLLCLRSLVWRRRAFVASAYLSNFTFLFISFELCNCLGCFTSTVPPRISWPGTFHHHCTDNNFLPSHARTSPLRHALPTPSHTGPTAPECFLAGHAVCTELELLQQLVLLPMSRTGLAHLAHCRLNIIGPLQTHMPSCQLAS